MIIVECPHCEKEHILTPGEIEELFRSGKVVITNCRCDKIYTTEMGNGCIFTK